MGEPARSEVLQTSRGLRGLPYFELPTSGQVDDGVAVALHQVADRDRVRLVVVGLAGHQHLMVAAADRASIVGLRAAGPTDFVPNAHEGRSFRKPDGEDAALCHFGLRKSEHEKAPNRGRRAERVINPAAAQVRRVTQNLRIHGNYGASTRRRNV